MNTHADKTQEDKSQAVANSLSKLQSKGELTFQFVDNRPEAIAQRKLKEVINNSPRVKQLKAYQEMANNSPQVKQLRTYQVIADNFTSQTAQRKENLEKETLQGKFEPIQKKENNTGLPDNLKSGIENLSGYSMDDVKVHYNSDKPAQLQAYAYAQGTDIHLGSGQEKHLPHEAWHVVQQKQGRVKPTIQLKGSVNVNDDADLENEADIMGDVAFQVKEVTQHKLKDATISNTVQRYIRLDKAAAADTSNTAEEKSFTVDQGTQNLFTSQVTAPGEASANRYNTIVQKDGNTAVNLNVANNGELAVEAVAQPKNYFATDEKIAESNDVLLATFSAYTMVRQGESITLRLGDRNLRLYKVYPKNKITKTEGLATTSLHRCNEMATRVIGMHYHKQPRAHYNDNEGEGFEERSLESKVIRSLFTDAVFITAYAELNPEQRTVLARNTGINQFATQTAEIGMALQTRSTGNYTAQNKWNYHWAGIIAKSGSDFVTLENYNRADETVGASPAAGVEQDIRWFFQIYGTEEGHSFHERMEATGEFLNPLTTLHFKPKDTQSQHDIASEQLGNILSQDEVAVFLKGILGLKDPAAERAALIAMREADRRNQRRQHVKIGTGLVALTVVIAGILSEYYGYTKFTGLSRSK